MRSTEFIIERVLNLHTPESKAALADKVWAMLQQSYAKLPGGFATAKSIDELIAKSALWKIVTRSGEPSAVIIYKDQHGRKSIAVATNGTPQGKRDFAMLKSADIKLGRSWAEVSGSVEHLMKKMGATAIPAKFAPVLTHKEILSYNDDGVHYTRMIKGEPHEKIMYGTVHLSQAGIEKLAASGIHLHELPESFRIA